MPASVWNRQWLKCVLILFHLQNKISEDMVLANPVDLVSDYGYRLGLSKDKNDLLSKIGTDLRARWIGIWSSNQGPD